MNKNILITGGAGFIGSNLCLSLLNEDYNITILDNLSKQIHTDNPDNSYSYNLIKDKVRVIKGDVRDYNALKKAVNGQDIIVHLAAETGTGQSMYNIEKYIDVNVKATAQLLEVISQNPHEISKLILASSRAVYGEGSYFCQDHEVVFPDQRLLEDLEKGDFSCKCPFCSKDVKLQPTNEESELKPVSLYGLSKLQQEELVELVCKYENIPYSILRFQNVYGIGQSLINPYTGILSIFSSLIKSGKEINIFEDGLESRDFVHVSDIVNAIEMCITNPITTNEIFNVGSGISSSVLHVSNSIFSILNVPRNYRVSGDFRIGDIRHNKACTKKITRLTGYKPVIDFSTGLSEFINWSYEQIKENSSLYDFSINEMKESGLLKQNTEK